MVVVGYASGIDKEPDYGHLVRALEKRVGVDLKIRTSGNEAGKRIVNAYCEVSDLEDVAWAMHHAFRGCAYETHVTVYRAPYLEDLSHLSTEQRMEVRLSVMEEARSAFTCVKWIEFTDYEMS